jgi:hypothetical protein
VRARVAAEAARNEASRARWRACEERRQQDERRQRQRRQAQRSQHARQMEDVRQEERTQAHEARAGQARHRVESKAQQGSARMEPSRLYQRQRMPGVAPRCGLPRPSSLSWAALAGHIDRFPHRCGSARVASTASAL